MERLNSIPRELNEKILKQISWQYGILPTGKLGHRKAFLVKEMPEVRLLVEKDQRPPSTLITNSQWTYNLIHSDALWSLYDDATLQALAECATIFHRLEKPSQETFHRIQYVTYAYLRVNDIYHPTEALQNAINDVLNYWPDHPAEAGRRLCKLWNEFGFLWPQRLKLGYKHHVEETYDISSSGERRLHELWQAQAKDEAYARMEGFRAQRLFDQQEEGHWQTDATYSEERFHTFALSWRIINRGDLRPIHEFFSKTERDVFIEIIDSVVHRIPVHRPIRLLNLSTYGYLSWRNQPSCATTGCGPATLFNTCGANNILSSGSQILWQMEWIPPNKPATDVYPLEAKYESQYVRCGSKVYLYPVESVLLTTPTVMALTRASVPGDLSQQDQGKIRSLRLVDPSINSQEEHRWVIEMENLGMEYDDDLATHASKNVDIAIGRRRPILHGDSISLRQYHYLCSTATPGSASNPRMSSPAPLPVTLLSCPTIDSSTSIASNMRGSLSSPYIMNSPTNTSVTESVISTKRKALDPVLVKEIRAITNTHEYKWVVEVISPFPSLRAKGKRGASLPPFPAEALVKEAPLTSLGLRLNQVSNSLEQLGEDPSGSQELSDEDRDVCASASAEPFLRLYATKQQAKIFSHMIRSGTFGSLRKHFTN